MKVLAAILIFVTVGIIARAQTPAPAAQPRVVAGIASGNRSVKNSPFTAEAVSESVQTLADGNRIVRSSTSKLYRNSEGRFRQEFVSGTGGSFGTSFYYGDGVTVINPGQGNFYLDSQAKIARVFDKVASENIAIATTAPLAAARVLEPLKTIEMNQLSPEARVEIDRARAELDKVKASKDELKASTQALKAAAEEMATTVVAATPALALTSKLGTMSKWDSRTEDLGDQSYEGISAHGTRTVTTIPAGAIGNERPIEITYEKWYSNELQMVVYSKQSDPRTGEQTYRLTNINRNEPDPALFQVPNGYKVVSDSQGGTYTFNGTGQGGVYVRSTSAQGQGTSSAKGTTATGGTRTKNQN
jgi:hypothetical protein